LEIRHNSFAPSVARFGIVLDPEGYAPLAEVLYAVRKRVPDVSEQASCAERERGGGARGGHLFLSCE
jgi:hypothetical protein